MFNFIQIHAKVLLLATCTIFYSVLKNVNIINLLLSNFCVYFGVVYRTLHVQVSWSTNQLVYKSAVRLDDYLRHLHNPVNHQRALRRSRPTKKNLDYRFDKKNCTRIATLVVILKPQTCSVSCLHLENVLTKRFVVGVGHDVLKDTQLEGDQHEHDNLQ